MKLKLSLITFLLTLLISFPLFKLSNFSVENLITSNSEDTKSLLSSSNTIKAELTSGMKSLFSFSLSKFNKLSSKERFSGFPGISLTDSSLGNGPIFCEGWNRYFKSEPGNNAKSFFTNFDYDTIIKNYKSTKNATTKSKFSIPRTKNHFYFVGGPDYLSVYSSEEKVYLMLTKKINHMHNDIIYYKVLDSVNASGKYIKGGVEDMGNFKEGFCFSLNYKKNLKKSKWIICSDSYAQKKKWINCIAKLKLIAQTKNNSGIIRIAKLPTKVVSNKDKNRKSQNGNEESKKKPSSKWILLQDWSQCTLACGGGKSYLHRYCIQPDGAPACKGKAIKVKSCNTQPCDTVNEVINSDNTPQLPPIVKVMRISSKPARFIVNKIYN